MRNAGDHEGDIAELRADLRAAQAEIIELRTDVRSLRSFRDWIVGGTALFTFLAGLLFGGLKDLKAFFAH